MAEIYHLVWRSDWTRDAARGAYQPPSLAAEGFIHCTRELEKVVEVANQFFAEPHGDDLLLLALDESRVGAEVRDEDPGVGHLFPHLYGPMDLRAVVATHVMTRQDGRWRLPEELTMSERETPEARLAAAGITLPQPPAAVGLYVGCQRTGNLVVTAGQLPSRDGLVVYKGKLGADVSESDGKAAAQLAAVNALAQIKAAVGDLGNVTRVVRLEGYVASAAGFTAQPAVLNGASELLATAFGEIGRHARMAVGVAELPLGAAVEVCLWVEVAD